MNTTPTPAFLLRQARSKRGHPTPKAVNKERAKTVYRLFEYDARCARYRLRKGATEAEALFHQGDHGICLKCGHRSISGGRCVGPCRREG